MRSMRDSLRPVLALQHPLGPMARAHAHGMETCGDLVALGCHLIRPPSFPLQMPRHTCANANSASLLSVLLLL